VILNISLIGKIKRYFILFIKAKWIIKKPIKKKYFICSFNNASIISKILKKNYFILDNKNETIYLIVFLKTILNLTFKNFLHNYFLNLIKEIDPDIIISTVDTDTFFWKLKQNFPNKKLILVQNAKKTGNPSDLFANLKKLKFQKQKIDYVFLMNKPIKSEFEKYLDGKFILLGSMPNNSVKRITNFCKDYAFISQISNYGLKKFDSISNQKISDVFFQESKRLLKYFSIFKPNTLINVIPYNLEKKLYDYEKYIFKEISNELNLEINLLYKENRYSNYNKLDNFKCTIGITSTLLYENLGRGNKSGFFNYLKNYNIQGYSLSWPILEGETLISTEKNDYENFKRIMKYLEDASKSEWDETVIKLRENIMFFDEDNEKFRKLLIDLK